MSVPTFLVADLRTGDAIEEIPATRMHWTEVPLASGVWDCDLGIDDADPNLTAEGARSVWVERDGQLLYGGIIWTSRVQNGTLVQLAGNGMTSYLENNRRTIRSALGMTFGALSGGLVEWASEDVFGIISDLFDHARVLGFIGALDVLFSGPTGGATAGVAIPAWSVDPSQKPGIAKIISDLSAQVAFSTRQEYLWRGTNKPGCLMHVTYPALGRVTDVVLDTNKNAALYGDDRDATALATLVDATGATDGTTVPSSTAGPILSAAYPILEGSTQHPDLSDTDALTAQAAADLANMESPRQLLTLTVTEDENAQLGSFGVGDQVYVSAHRGRHVKVEGFLQVQTYEVNADSSAGVTMRVGLSNAPISRFRRVLSPAQQYLADLAGLNANVRTLAIRP